MLRALDKFSCCLEQHCIPCLYACILSSTCPTVIIAAERAATGSSAAYKLQMPAGTQSAKVYCSPWCNAIFDKHFILAANTLRTVTARMNVYDSTLMLCFLAVHRSDLFCSVIRNSANKQANMHVHTRGDGAHVLQHRSCILTMSLCCIS